MKIRIKKRSFIFSILSVLLLLFLFSYNNTNLNKITGYATGFVTERDSSESYTTENDLTINNLVDYDCPDCNIIILMIDTLRTDHMGSYGYPRDTTPNIDKLAKEGILFENMIAQSSWTKPSVGSLFTGLYPKNHGAWEGDQKLSEDKLLLSEILKKKGYNTYAFSTNPTVVSEAGYNQGFDDFHYFNSTEEDYLVYVKADEVHQTVIPFIKNLKQKEKNFIYIHYMDPHTPYMPKEKHFSKSNTFEFTEKFFHEYHVTAGKNLENDEKSVNILIELIKQYDDEILFNDKMVGELLQTLKEEGLYDNSIIMVMSDHGEEFFEHTGNMHGKSLFKEVLSVPLIMRVPKTEPQRIKEQIGHIDIMPMVLDILKISVPSKIDGINVLKDKKRDYVYSELNHRHNSLYSIRSLTDKLILGTYLIQGNIFWTNDSLDIQTLNNNNLTILAISFFKERELNIIQNDKIIKKGTITSYGEEIELSLKTDPDSTNNINKISLTSHSPCKKVSELGRMDDDRCLSFGVAPSSQIERVIYPATFYYQLENDPYEEENLYINFETQPRIEELEEKLFKYIKERNIVDSKEVNYTDQQLEALKALGYI